MTHQPPNRVFPVPYQVDFSVESKGRHLDSTKRKLMWKFGFADPPSIFPHLFDANANENYTGDLSSDSSNNGTIVPYSNDRKTKKGVECRGREHEIILTWSLLTGKAHIYVDNSEIYRHDPLEETLFNPFSASFHRGFDLPNPQFNGRHRIDIRCYARTPMGAKNMVVDDTGSKFRQYDLTVDGLSYFSMPAMFELGTHRMWGKVSRWGLDRLDSQEEGVPNGESHRYDHTISKSEQYKAMNPRSESDEERMIRIATEASLKDWDKDHAYGNTHGSSRSRSSEELKGNGRKDSSRRAKKKESSTKKLGAIGEDNLIDFGSDASQIMSQMSDISVIDDDATTASFMMNTAWNSSGAPPPPPPQQQPIMSHVQPYVGQLYPNQQQEHHQQQQQQPQYYKDPTFRAKYTKKPWASVGAMPSNPVTPRSNVGIPSDASFAVPPPPTMDDYNNAFGGLPMNMGASVITNYHSMSPESVASVGTTSPMAQMQQQPQMAHYGMQQASQWQSQSGGSVAGGMSMPVGASPQMAKSNMFDPMRADPFAS